MRTYRLETAAVPDALHGAAIALGNMDGVHLGHQSVIGLAARRAGAESDLAVAVFDPHPRRFFKPDAAPFRLQSDAQRARALNDLGVDTHFIIPFDATLAAMSDEGFARDLLVRKIRARAVSVGFDFTFGRGRMGDGARLRALGQDWGFEVDIAAPLEHPKLGAKVSSTAIRAALAQGDLALAETLLSRPFAIEGKVERGFQRGRILGFPTLNIPLGDYVRPKFGVYAVWAATDGGGVYPGVANLGVRPTIAQGEAPLLEAHVFDFDGDLYGAQVEIRFARFLRPERRFDGLDALKAQIAIDAGQARSALAG